jgi:UDPglucose 6-dehydrogenase
MNIAVIGTGYVGLVTGVVLAELGNHVVCVDNDLSKVAKLREGIPPIYEPGVEELLRRGLSEGFLTISSSICEATKASEIVFIAVGTPPGPDGSPDLTAVRAVAAEIGAAIEKYTVVVNKSTVPVGSGSLVQNILIEQGADPSMFDVVSNPEFLREGSAIRDTLEPDRIVIGAKRKEAAAKLVELYAPLERPVILTDLCSAEFIKYASNCFLATKISFINAISRLCELSGANVGDVAKGVGSDARIGMQFLQAGLGWGGSCFPKDVQGLLAISEELGYRFELLESVTKINDTQTEHFLQRIESRLGGMQGKTLAILGLAFKPNTDDIRDAKSLAIIKYVIDRGGKVRCYDPIAMPNVKAVLPPNEALTYVDRVYDVAENADALVLVTEWNEFKQVDLKVLGKQMRSKILFDGRRCYNRLIVERAEFEYHVVGESSKYPGSEKK